MKAKIVVEGKEFPIEILDPELEKLIKPQKKKTGYERVETPNTCLFVNGAGEVRVCSCYDDAYYDAANYYSDKTVATNNARADKLMRQLRRFAVEHREKELNWLNGSQNKYTISFDYQCQVFDVDYWTGCSEFGTMYFDSEATAELAIETFKDELLWYFTEYEDSL